MELWLVMEVVLGIRTAVERIDDVSLRLLRKAMSWTLTWQLRCFPPSDTSVLTAETSEEPILEKCVHVYILP